MKQIATELRDEPVVICQPGDKGVSPCRRVSIVVDYRIEDLLFLLKM